MKITRVNNYQQQNNQKNTPNFKAKLFFDPHLSRRGQKALADAFTRATAKIDPHGEFMLVKEGQGIVLRRVVQPGEASFIEMWLPPSDLKLKQDRGLKEHLIGTIAMMLHPVRDSGNICRKEATLARSYWKLAGATGSTINEMATSFASRQNLTVI